MSGIIKVTASVFPKGKEVAIKRHRSRVLVNKDKHIRVFEFKKHDRIFGIEGAISSVWNWWFLAKALLSDHSNR